MEYLESIQNLKKKMKEIEESNMQLRYDNQHLKTENNKQQNRIGQLLNPVAGAVNHESLRKEAEKNTLVRQLK